MYATYRIEFSPSPYVSDGSLAINSTINLPDRKESLEIFKKALDHYIKVDLERTFDTFLLGEQLKEELKQKQLDETSLLEQDEPIFEDGWELPVEAYEKESSAWSTEL
jgi:hypothetical protein